MAGQYLGNYIAPVNFRCHIWPVDFCFGSTVLAGIKPRCILGPIFGRRKIFGQCLGNYIAPVYFRFRIWPGNFFWQHSPGQYIWHSRIPRVPGIRPARNTVPVPGMEVVGTLWCPYVMACHPITISNKWYHNGTTSYMKNKLSNPSHSIIVAPPAHNLSQEVENHSYATKPFFPRL